MLKLIGAGMILVASTAMGFSVAAMYRNRPAELRSLQSALKLLESEIDYASRPLPEALAEVARRLSGPERTLLNRASQLLGHGDVSSASRAWELAVEEYFSASSLSGADRDVLIDLGRSLGISDRDDQIRHLRLALSRLVRQEETAEEDRSRNERLWRYLGILSGGVLVLIFI